MFDVKRNRGRRVEVAIAVAGGLAALSIPTAASANGGVELTVHRATGAHGQSAPSRATLRLQRQGYLVPNQRRYERQKAAAARQAPAPSAEASPTGPAAPSTVRAWAGVFDPNVAPSDSTSAVGTARYIETINQKFAIYNKTSSTPISSGTLAQLWASGSSTSDPQILWDPTTRRFYYAGLDISSASNNLITFGYSKTPHPSSAADFCHYFLSGYGTNLPDYPKLGDIKGHLIIGVNTFGLVNYLRSDAITISKPPSGTGCVSASTFLLNQRTSLKNANGTLAFTPVPANQTDTSKTGYIVAITGQNVSGSTKLTEFKVTTNPDGTTSIPAQGTTVTVPSYSVPPNAPQSGTANTLDTLDGRLTQAVSGNDPLHGGNVAIWTQHSVAGGAGSEVRWYEIDPAANTVLQSGKATSASLYEFNGAISPNRAVKGSTKSGGDSMVMGYNTSSSSTFPAIQAVSKVGAGAQSSPLTIVTSPNPDVGFDCSPCRWGDYAGASPDPNPASGSQVWLVNMFNNGTNHSFATWKTENFIVSP